MDPEKIKTLPSPRFIKTHMPLSLLPPSLLETAKVVYVARNPRDVAVSNYYHIKSHQVIPAEGEFKPFWKLFIDNHVIWSPYFEHVKEAWRQRNHPNMAFIFYEELSKDLPGVARRLAKFFGKEYSEEQFEALYNHLKFDNFKNNKSVNMAEWQKTGIITDSFIRKGKAGGWRDHFDEEMMQQADRWIEENLRDTDLQFPTDFLGPEEAEAPRSYYTELRTEYIRLGSAGYFFYKQFNIMALEVYNMPLRPTDTFVVTFPRSGTTWTQELVWLLQSNLDFEGAKATPMATRCPFLEFRACLFDPPTITDPNDSFEKFKMEVYSLDPAKIKTMPSPRFIKTHMPLSLLPPTLLETTKVVYVARNPLDVAVSNFYHMKSNRVIPLDGEFKPYWKLFMEDKVLWSPFFEHVKEAWLQRNHRNMAFIFYEELSKDLSGVARRLAKFFGKEYSEDQFEALHDHLKFDNFKNNTSVNNAEWKERGITKGSFIRKGKTGGWRDYFDEEMTQQANRWIEENLRDTDLRFPQTD
ncbi:sulfotransferase 1E1-like [Epargyreus clarus]|uniref:sulfotransferase 1E1-like n=1 Tax=Epargyreus clarus TaxID=520877 RepID=UPI003C2DFB38